MYISSVTAGHWSTCSHRNMSYLSCSLFSVYACSHPWEFHAPNSRHHTVKETLKQIKCLLLGKTLDGSSTYRRWQPSRLNVVPSFAPVCVDGQTMHSTFFLQPKVWTRHGGPAQLGLQHLAQNWGLVWPRVSCSLWGSERNCQVLTSEVDHRAESKAMMELEKRHF